MPLPGTLRIKETPLETDRSSEALVSVLTIYSQTSCLFHFPIQSEITNPCAIVYSISCLGSCTLLALFTYQLTGPLN